MKKGVNAVEWKIAFLIMLGLCGIFVVVTFFLRPLKFLLRLSVYLVVGTVLLAVLNLALGGLGIHVAVNPATMLTAGFLQVPGVILLVVLDVFFT